MNLFHQIISSVKGLFTWWAIVLPWERALRIRLGKAVKILSPGVHFRIPFIDQVFTQNVRERIIPTTGQTITTSDGKAVSLRGSLRFRIADLEKLFSTLHQAEETIVMHAEGLLAHYISTHPLELCDPLTVSQFVSKRLELEKYGFSPAELVLTEFAVVKTFRIINGDMLRWNRAELETSAPNLTP